MDFGIKIHLLFFVLWIFIVWTEWHAKPMSFASAYPRSRKPILAYGFFCLMGLTVCIYFDIKDPLQYG